MLLVRFVPRWLGLVALVILLVSPSDVSAQVLTTLANFNRTNGTAPYAGLVQGSDGNFYGTTVEGGTSPDCGVDIVTGLIYGCGTVYRITPTGVLTTLANFNASTGSYPWAGVVQGSDGNFYGTTVGGGTFDRGTVFRMTPDGTITTLVNFTSSTGSYPYGTLIQASDGNFYGTTSYGPTFNGTGTVFRMTPEGTLSTLIEFTATTGGTPAGPLVQGTDGSLYGNTGSGGKFDYGTVFRIKINKYGKSEFTTLVNFKGGNGAAPNGGMVEGPDGNFYGTTFAGGSSTNCRDRCGTVFRMTPAGQLTTLINFNVRNGGKPRAGLFLGGDGNLYGTTSTGGNSSSCSNGCGTVFKITPSGTFTTQFAFDYYTNGGFLTAPVVQGSDGALYGTTYSGGTFQGGTVFRLMADMLSPLGR